MKILIYKDTAGVHSISDNVKFEAKRCKHDYLIIDSSELPNRDYRNAWDIVDGKVVEDIDKAKELHKEKIRIARKTLFEENDILLRDASIENDSEKLSAGIKERDRLRDLPQKVDDCKTIEEIKSIGV